MGPNLAGVSDAQFDGEEHVALLLPQRGLDEFLAHVQAVGHVDRFHRIDSARQRPSRADHHERRIIPIGNDEVAVALAFERDAVGIFVVIAGKKQALVAKRDFDRSKWVGH